MQENDTNNRKGTTFVPPWSSVFTAASSWMPPAVSPMRPQRTAQAAAAASSTTTTAEEECVNSSNSDSNRSTSNKNNQEQLMTTTKQKNDNNNHAATSSLSSFAAANSSTPLSIEQQQPPSENQHQGQAEDNERYFFFELLHFARNRNWKKKLMTFLIMSSSAYVLFDIFFLGHIRNGIVVALEWITQHPFGAIFSFIAFFVVATLLFVPPAILMFGAGWAFSNTAGFGYGVLVSSAVSFIGSCLGAILAFLRARYMMRDLIQLFAQRYPIVKAADTAFQQNGFKVMLLLRLCPIIPFNGLNYIGGVTAISLEEFTKAMIGIIPTVLLWTFSGAAADRIAAASTQVEGDGAQLYMIILLSTGIVFGVVAAILIWKYSIGLLKKEIHLENAESWWRYKKMSQNGSPIKIEEGQEVTVEEHHEQMQKLHGLLPALGFHSMYGLEGHYSGRNDTSDEEWYWLFSPDWQL